MFFKDKIYIILIKSYIFKILEFIMTAPKQEAKKVIDSLPEDTSYDEILKELAFDRMIQRGLKDSSENKTISNQEMKNRIKQW
jgi:hypothetical protein